MLILFHLKEFIDLLFVFLRFLNTNYRTPYIYIYEQEKKKNLRAQRKHTKNVSKQKVIRTFAPQEPMEK